MIPAEIVSPLLAWYEREKRDLPWRRTRDPYRIWVSEIMLQQTRVEAVRDYYARFMGALPDVQALAAADEQLCLKLWEGLGYYSRVRNLHRAAQVVCSEYGGALPRSYAGLIRLPGIGDYTAGAIASIAFGERVPAVDGNVLRVAARLTGDSRPVTEPAVRGDLREQVAALVPEERPGTFNQAMMELGATVCIPNGAPHCPDCPLASLCEGFRAGTAPSLPVKAAKKPRRVEPRTVFLLFAAPGIALRRRPKKGLLAGLWELPSAEGTLSPAEAQALLEGWGLHPGPPLALPPAKHIFTHIEWHMTGYSVRCDTPADGFTWVSPPLLRAEYALPSAFRPFLEVLYDL